MMENSFKNYRCCTFFVYNLYIFLTLKTKHFFIALNSLIKKNPYDQLSYEMSYGFLPSGIDKT